MEKADINLTFRSPAQMETRRKLAALVAASSGESANGLIRRLIEEEFDRLGLELPATETTPEPAAVQP